VIAAQGHLGIAAQSAKVIANAIPRQLQRSCLPPLPEGLLVIAKKTVPDSTTM
jgi:hypothetical protein